VLVGHIIWQGRPAQPSTLQQAPLTLTLKLGSTEIDYPQMTTDASGYCTVTLSGLPQGTYSWRVKGPKFLANSGLVTLNGLKTINPQPSTFSPLSSIPVEMGMMHAGDATNDNLVSTLDFNLVKISFGKGIGEPR